MKSPKKSTALIIKDGELTGFGVFCAITLGALIIYLSIKFSPWFWLRILGLSLGLSIMGLGGYSARAKALGLPPPFTSDPLGWRKAKDSYKSNVEETKKDD